MKTLIMNARSYDGINTDTDHRLVLAKTLLNPKKIHKTKKKTEPIINTNNFNNPENQKKYESELSEIIINEENTTQDIWNQNVKKRGKRYLG